MKAEIAQVAIELFLAEGFDQTTVDQVARAAGLSRATFFRYFSTKEDVVLEQAVDFGLHLRDALVRRPDDEPVWAAIRKALGPVVELQTEHQDLAVRVAQMMLDAPTIRARHHEKVIAWQDLLVPEVARRLRVGTGAAIRPNDPRPAALVACALSCLDAALHAWASAPDDADLADLLDAAMGAISSGGRPPVPAPT